HRLPRSGVSTGPPRTRWKGARALARFAPTVRREHLQVRAVRQHPAALIGGAVIAIIAGWIAYKAFGNGFTGATTTGPQFVLVTLNGLTLAGLYFIVASGFNLIF